MEQASYNDGQWDNEGATIRERREPPVHQGDANLNHIMNSFQALVSAIASIQLQSEGAWPPQCSLAQDPTPPPQAAAMRHVTQASQERSFLTVGHQGTINIIATKSPSETTLAAFTVVLTLMADRTGTPPPLTS